MAPLETKFNSGPSETRFWNRVMKTARCWIWDGAIRLDGYGELRVDGRKTLSHRYSYTLAHGSIPDGLVIDHKCYNRKCVNPEHLQAVSFGQNLENRQGAQSNSSTGIRGVYWSSQKKKYVGIAQSHGKRYYAGSFDSIKDAERAVIALRNTVHTNNLQDRKAS